MNSPLRSYPYQNEPIWSRSERATARRVFDAALKRELHEVMREAKQMANRISDPEDLWALERYLTQRRKDIDGKYDFRSSRLTQLFGRLLCERRITGGRTARFTRRQNACDPFLRQGSVAGCSLTRILSAMAC